MKVAILYTGELRTFKKTIILFVKNILDILDKQNCHVFATVQPTSYGKYVENIDEYISLFIDKMQNSLKSLEILDKNDGEWLKIKQQSIDILKSKGLSEGWINYLSNSGSMIEYYQMYKSYQKMVDYEKQNNTRFDFVIRFRTDTIWTKPLDLSWYNNLELSNISNISNMSSIFTDVENKHGKSFIIPNSQKFILTFRENVIYMCPRDIIDDISILGITYGIYKDFENNDYWFNAESQFRGILIKNNISYFDFMGVEEGKMMTDIEYNSQILDENFENTKKDLLFAIIRT
jgi:hypothetical protein